MNVRITDYKPIYKEAFKELNYEWISQLFEIEESDKEILENPEESILKKGGAILIALSDEEPVGVCALIKVSNDNYELAKMAVSPKAQGNQIGYKLGSSIIEKAKSLNAKSVYLETNTSLKPALALYKKLGFKELKGCKSEYSRCNVQMELAL